MVLLDEEAADRIYTLQPNCAMSWRWMKLLFLGLFCCMAAFSAYWVSLGAWLVLPFFGLELVVLGLGLYLSALAGSTREVVHIDPEQVRILRGRRQLETVATLPRYWTRAELIEDPRGWYLSRLQLHCHGKRIEIASKLVESERQELAGDLEHQLGFGFPAERPRGAGLIQGSPSPQISASNARVRTEITDPHTEFLLPKPPSRGDNGFENNNHHTH